MLKVEKKANGKAKNSNNRFLNCFISRHFADNADSLV